MIYVQLRSRTKIALGQPVLLENTAQLIAPAGAGTLPIPCPDREGIWKLQAITVTRILREHFPKEDITFVGDDVCCIHRVRPAHRDLTRPLRTAAAFLILCLGAALGLAWFHADVNMPHAQYALYESLTGEEPRSAEVITVPYVIGVALGVAVFYALPGRSATTPLEVKLTEYQEDMEKTEGRDIE